LKNDFQVTKKFRSEKKIQNKITQNSNLGAKFRSEKEKEKKLKKIQNF
jgi:hypothetical protein